MTYLFFIEVETFQQIHVDREVPIFIYGLHFLPFCIPCGEIGIEALDQRNYFYNFEYVHSSQKLYKKIIKEVLLIAWTVMYMYYRNGKIRTVSGIMECNIASILHNNTNIDNTMGIVGMPLYLFDENINVVQEQNFNRNTVVQIVNY